MADSASEFESDTSSVDGGPTTKMLSPGHIEQLNKRIESLQQENRVLRMELDTYKLRCKTLQEDNRELRQASVTIQAQAEQEEEFISNTLLKKIQTLKKEKEVLAMNYEQEEEFLTNDLSRKLMQLRQEKVELEQTLEKEQEYQVNRLMRKIEKLESETVSKQNTLEQLRREKVELENSLEQEQESLVNRLWKRMDKLESEKRMLQEKLDQPISQPHGSVDKNFSTLSGYVQTLKVEVKNLRKQLVASQAQYAEKMAHYAEDEKHIREENLRLQRKLQMEIERREALCRHLSESESSLEMDDERLFNEMTKHQEQMSVGSQETSMGGAIAGMRASHPRKTSSPIPMAVSEKTRPLSPAAQHYVGPAAISPPSPMRYSTCGMAHNVSPSCMMGASPPQALYSHTLVQSQSGDVENRDNGIEFAKPLTPSAPGDGPKSHTQDTHNDSDSNVDMLLQSPTQSDSDHGDKS